MFLIPRKKCFFVSEPQSYNTLISVKLHYSRASEENETYHFGTERKRSNTPSSFLPALFLQIKQPLLSVPAVLPIAFLCFPFFFHCNVLLFLVTWLWSLFPFLSVDDYIKKGLSHKKFGYEAQRPRFFICAEGLGARLFIDRLSFSGRRGR